MFTTGGLASSGAADKGDPGSAGDDELAGGDARSQNEYCASLRRTIEAEIIPRLMLAHVRPSNDDAPPADATSSIDAGEVATLTELILRQEPTEAQRYVRRRRDEGVPVEALYLDLLAPAAQRLGAMWEADLCDFTQVTLGLWRLQQIVFEYSPTFPQMRGARSPLRRALLVPAPGSQHTFGVMLVGEFFRRAGWDTVGDPCAGLREIASMLSGEWFDLIGLSVSTDFQADSLASAILVLREASVNPAIVVMIGGPVLGAMPDVVERVGADGTASDAAGAVALAERLVARRTDN